MTAKIYVTGDLHGQLGIEKFSSAYFKKAKKLGKQDYVIVAGDFGIPWSTEKADKSLLKWLEKLPFSILFIDGNHENFDLLNKYPLMNWSGGKVHQLSPHVLHLMRGQIYTIAGKTFFTFGGAASTDKEWRVEGMNWWPDEMPSIDERNEGISQLMRKAWKVDFVITHTAPTRFIDYVQKSSKRKVVSDELTDYLDIIYTELNFKNWFFGHFHSDLVLNDRVIAVYSDMIDIV